jgi:thiol-disulfide isomerase/thioredoxin
MILDWEEFRKSDRRRDIEYIFTDILFDGATAGINSEMCSFFSKLPDCNIQNFNRRMRTENSSPGKYEEIYSAELGEYYMRFQDLLKSENLQPRTKRLLNIYMYVNRTRIEMIYGGRELPPDFPKNDLMLILFHEVSSIVSALVNNKYIMDIQSKVAQSKKTLKEYLHGELGLEQTVQDSLFYVLFDSLSKNRNVKYSREQKEEQSNIGKNFFEKYGEQINEYEKIYAKPAEKEFRNIKRTQIEDSIFTHVLKIKPGLLYELMQLDKYRRILQIRPFTAGEKEEIKRSFTYILPQAQSLIDKSDNIEKMIASDNKGVIINENPVVEREKLMETIIEKYRGKVVFVNFWIVHNIPCLDALKTMLPIKEELQAKGVVFLYITGEEISFIDEWIQKVPEIHGEHYRLTGGRWNFLYNKLGIKSVPACLIYDKNGNVASELYNGYPGNETVKNVIEKELLRNY